MANVVADARRAKAIGSITEFVMGVVSLSGNQTLTLVLPQFSVVQGVVANGSVNDKVIGTGVTGNSIVLDNEDAGTNVVNYIAWGLGFN